MFAAIVAAVLVSILTIDLGRLFPQLKPLAEREASQFLDRPMKIGRLSALLSGGRFVLEDVVIEGRRPEDRPFLEAGRIDVYLPWWSIFQMGARPHIRLQVELTDWDMLIETWQGGAHNVPRLTGPPRDRPSGPRPFDITTNFVYARRGEFAYEDHATPWSVVARNLNFELVRAEHLKRYVGKAQFSNGTVQIQQFKPMRADMTTRFYLDGPAVDLQHIDLTTDGSVSHINGHVDFRQWRTQTYNVNSTVDFARMKELFFARESWRVNGDGRFTGVFKLFPGGRELAGEFSSVSAAVNALDFRNLHGALIWTPDRFAVTHAEANVLGGATRFAYGLAPLGTRTGATATFGADFSNVDLFELDRLVSMRGLRLAGLATGRVDMTWPNGRFGPGHRGVLHARIAPPEGVDLAPKDLPGSPRPLVPEPFEGQRRLGTLAFGADLHGTFDSGGITFDESWAATSSTYIAFSGRMGGGSRPSEFRFHVSSHDWQHSDRLLAGIMTAVSGPTRVIEVSGRGIFDGVMTGTFRAPRIEGHFESQETRVWDVTWGAAGADVVIENGYVDIANARIGRGGEAVILPSGRFALGGRRDGQEEIRAHVTILNWPLADFRHAFGQDDWRMDGTVAEARLDLNGRYTHMFGSGPVRIAHGEAWGERLDEVTGQIVLEGTGIQINRVEMHKGPGVVRGAARIGWDGTYAFNAEGADIAVESLDNFRLTEPALTGRLRFKASGAGEFTEPFYAFEGAIDDLFIGSEGIGSITGRLTVSNDVMTIERVVAASSRLQGFGSGTIALDDKWTSDLRFRFQDTAIDPYLKFVWERDISEFTRAVVGGTLSVRGPLGDRSALSVEAAVTEANLTLYDYTLQNDGPVVLTFQNGLFRIGALRLKGSDTNLELRGSADAETLDLTADGDASLSILQLFSQGLTASGAATLSANLSGSFEAPRLTGAAAIINGRLRPIDSPHGLESVNGRIVFGASELVLDGVTGRLASGDVAFGGNIALEGLWPAEYNLAARGRSLRLRYPEGFLSTVDMDLFLTGPLSAPRLSGTVDVLRVAFLGLPQAEAGLFGLTTGGAQPTPAASLAPTQLSAEADTPGELVALDIQVSVPRMPIINIDELRVEATADLQVRGTFNQPRITGAVQIVGGEFLFNGNRYLVREGMIDFTNPERLDPVFDLAAETRPRVAGQTFVVNARVTGTRSALNFELTSDPWLPDSDIISLLFGGTPQLGTVEQRALRSSQELQQQMVQTVGAALLARPLTSRVGDVFERTGAFDTVQITPVLAYEAAFQQLDPGARITLGKRISPRVFLTYSRTLSNASQEEIILFEYDQSDRVSWVLSRNENRTFSLDFRIRYVF
jgi:hypothetical protein